MPVGKITEILGEHLAPGMEIEVALRAHNLPHEWPAAVIAEAAKIPDQVQPQDIEGRKDLRDLPLVTIDGADARDFDDAIFAKRRLMGWTLWVAIADVSAYVKPGTALDTEAYARGNSVYFPRQVIPMLPEKLSNGLCSLNPDVDRLCMVCEMKVSNNGEVSGAKFYPAVMRSHARLIYEQVIPRARPARCWVTGSRICSRSATVSRRCLRPAHGAGRLISKAARRASFFLTSARSRPSCRCSAPARIAWSRNA